MEDRIDMAIAGSRTVAVVGISEKPDRPSHGVAKYLLERGYRIVPVNPALSEVLGVKAYGSLSAIPGPVDLVDVFRKPEHVPPIAEEAVRAGVRFFWMQEGVVSPEACAILDAAGIPWVMDRCLKRELVKRGR